MKMHVFIWVLAISDGSGDVLQFGEQPESVPDIIDEDDCTYLH